MGVTIHGRDVAGQGRTVALLGQVARSDDAAQSSRNLVGTRVVDSTNCFEALTYFTMVGM